MSDRTYPLPAPDEDPRFTFGLIYDIRKRLEAAGYPPLTSSDHVNLQQALFGFLYEVRILSTEELDAIRARHREADLEAARATARLSGDEILADWERELLERTDTEDLTTTQAETRRDVWAAETAAEEDRIAGDLGFYGDADEDFEFYPTSAEAFAAGHDGRGGFVEPGQESQR